MPYSAAIQGGVSLKPQPPAGTENADTLARGAVVNLTGVSNTVAQALMDFDDYVEGSGDPAVIQLNLSPPGGTFTAVAATNVITTSANHGRAIGDEVRFTNSGGVLPGGLTAGVSYYVLDVPASNTMTVAALPAGTVIDITDTGSGTHSWQGYTAIADYYEYPTTGPGTPVRILDRRDGAPNDFTRIKGLGFFILPTDRTLAASGKVWLTFGDPAEPTRYVNFYLELAAAANTDGIAFATQAMPPGIAYDDYFPVRIGVEAAENLSAILNLAGN